MPPPTPVPSVTPISDGQPLPAPTRASASVKARASLTSLHRHAEGLRAAAPRTGWPAHGPGRFVKKRDRSRSPRRRCPARRRRPWRSARPPRRPPGRPARGARARGRARPRARSADCRRRRGWSSVVEHDPLDVGAAEIESEVRGHSRAHPTVRPELGSRATGRPHGGGRHEAGAFDRCVSRPRARGGHGLGGARTASKRWRSLAGRLAGARRGGTPASAMSTSVSSTRAQRRSGRCSTARELEIWSLAYYPNKLDPDLGAPRGGPRAPATRDRAARGSASRSSERLSAPTRSVVTENCASSPRSGRRSSRRGRAGVKIAIENCPMIFSTTSGPAAQPGLLAAHLARDVQRRSPIRPRAQPRPLAPRLADDRLRARGLRLRRPILHVHAKDMEIDRDGLYEHGMMSAGMGWQMPRLPGLGEVRWDRFVAALYAVGYDGVDVGGARGSRTSRATWSSSSAAS